MENSVTLRVFSIERNVAEYDFLYDTTVIPCLHLIKAYLKQRRRDRRRLLFWLRCSISTMRMPRMIIAFTCRPRRHFDKHVTYEVRIEDRSVQCSVRQLTNPISFGLFRHLLSSKETSVIRNDVESDLFWQMGIQNLKI
jgi:hypothetical protein